MMRHPSTALVFFAVLTVGFHTWSAIAEGQLEFGGTTMGPIQYRVVVRDEISEPGKVKQAVRDALEEVNALMSTYQPTSDVSRFNIADADTWIAVDPLTLGVVERALEISRLTEGAFDITVGPAVNRWGFGPKKEGSFSPDKNEINGIRQLVGYQKLEARQSPAALKKSNAKTQIDLSAIAKGFAVDRVARVLLEQKLTNFMVEVGGEVYVSGRSSFGDWRIGIEKPIADVRSVHSVALLRDAAMATSGDYRNFKLTGKRTYSHSIDPKTCCPVENGMVSCSVVADDCMTADALSTAFMVMGGERALEFCADQGCHALIIQRTEDNTDLTTTATADFPTSDDQVEPKPASIFAAFAGAVLVFGLAIVGMAIGAIFNNRPIRGSCGGIATTPGEDGSDSCSLCQKPVMDCPEKAGATD